MQKQITIRLIAFIKDDETGAIWVYDIKEAKESDEKLLYRVFRKSLKNGPKIDRVEREEITGDPDRGATTKKFDVTKQFVKS